MVTLIVAITEGRASGVRLPRSLEYEEKRNVFVEDILRGPTKDVGENSILM